jgi:hypothetical protein
VGGVAEQCDHDDYGEGDEEVAAHEFPRGQV